MAAISRFLRAVNGTTAIECAVLTGLVLLACVTAIMLVGQRTALDINEVPEAHRAAVVAGR